MEKDDSFGDGCNTGGSESECLLDNGDSGDDLSLAETIEVRHATEQLQPQLLEEPEPQILTGGILAEEPELREFDSGSQPVTGLRRESDWPYSPNQWHRVSKKYLFVDFVATLITLALIVWLPVAVLWSVGPLGILADEYPLLGVLAGAAIAVITVTSLIVSLRRIKTIGYVLRDDDFVYRRGVLFQKVVAVPYGRLQLVEVKEGPILRAANLVSLRFVTAAAGSNLELPGLEREVGERLRDELIAVAETWRSGL